MTSHPTVPQIFSDLESLLTYASLDLIATYVPPLSRTPKMNNLYALRSQISEIIIKSRTENFTHSPNLTPSPSLTSNESSNSLYQNQPKAPSEPQNPSSRDEIATKKPFFLENSESKKFQNSNLRICDIMGGFDYGWERLDLGLYEGVIEEDDG